MTDDPLLLYLVEALNLVHPRFAGVDGSGPPDRAAFARELYHQLRRLWDKALPVQLGLGHLLFRSDPAGRADLVVWQLGEKGEPDRRLGAVAVLTPDDLPPADRGTILVCVGPEPPDLPPGRPAIHYNTDRRAASVLSPG